MIEIRHKGTGEVLIRLRTETLAWARLRDRELAGADLRGAALPGADLAQADLTGADLEGANLTGVRGRSPALGVRVLFLSGCCLPLLCALGGALTLALHTETTIMSGVLGALFPLGLLGTFIAISHALIRPPRTAWTVILKGANLRDANLRNADLSRGDLTEAVLTGADARDARLEGALLARASLQSARLQGAHLQEADLRGADLRGADLRQAHLQQADLCDADLRGADVRAYIAGVRLVGARCDETTRWPAGFQPARHGCLIPTEVLPASVPAGRGDEVSPEATPPDAIVAARPGRARGRRRRRRRGAGPWGRVGLRGR